MADLLGLDFDPPINPLVKNLRQLEGNLPTKGMRTSLVASIAPLKKSIKVKIDSVTGALKGSIGHKSLSKSAKRRLNMDADEVALLVGATRKTAGSIGAPAGKRWDQNYKLNWLERGTRPHMIPGDSQFKKRKMLKFGNLYRQQVSHPGTSGTDLVYKSLQSTRMQQQSLFDQKLKAFLDKNTP
ncbi:MAG: hypothetical protein JAY88_14755 [Candidatus Thiodiazotropha lotti]|nr:hypothetical protein [Candidatus Thiodiazotropha lotti]MCW4188324.1 hypothetical protein [Candidatus Thiodiazotropha lotti]